MRNRLSIAAAMVLTVTGCAMPSVNNLAADAGPVAGRSTATLAISGPGIGRPCAAAWNGETVTEETLARRAFAELERVIAAAGGIDQLREIPSFRVEAAATLPWSCVGPWLEVVGRSGFASAQIATGARDESAPSLAFPLGEAPPVPVPLPVITVGAEGHFLWDGEAVDGAGLRQRLAGRGYRSEETPPSVVPAPTGGWSLVPGDGATVGTMREALRILAAAGIEPVLGGPPSRDPRLSPPPPDPLANRR